MKNSKEIATPMVINVKLDSDADGKLINSKYYKSAIRGLLYLIANPPDILFAVSMCAKF